MPLFRLANLIRIAACASTAIALVPDLAAAEHKGPPNDRVGCSGSPTRVNAEIPAANGAFARVVDINTIWVENRVAGWMYRTNDGKTRVLLTPSRRTYAVGSGTSQRSFGTPGDRAAYFSWSGPLPQGMRARKCFERGRQFVAD